MQRNKIKHTAILIFCMTVAVAVSVFAVSSGNITVSSGQAEKEKLFKEMGILPIPPTIEQISFQLEDVNGRLFSTRDFHGKIVFLNFWTTWCPACIIEMPAMEKLHRKFKDRPFAVVAVNLQESADTVRQFAKKNGLSFLTLLDPRAELGSFLGIRQIPTTFIIDGKGKIIGTALGPREWDGDKSLALFEHLMANNLASEN